LNTRSGAAQAVVRAVGRRVGRIEDPRFWRLAYRALDSRLVVRLAAAVLRRLPPARQDHLLRRFASAVVFSGWPRQGPGWTNLHASRFLTRLRREVAGARPVARRAAVGRTRAPLRVGCVAQFSGLLTFTKEHFEAAPDDELELSVFDIEYQGHFASYLGSVCSQYTQFAPLTLAEPGSIEALAAAVNAADLDVLVVLLRDPPAGELLDLVETPCIVEMCASSDLLHHPRVGFHVYPQPEADYFVRGRRLFCATSHSEYGPEAVWPGFFLYDTRGLEPASFLGFAERDPLVFVHGSLYKAASPPFLGVLFGLLERDRDLELVFMGHDNGRALDLIRSAAGARGVAGRVTYDGLFSPVRGPDGRVSDPGWLRVESYLRRARLAPDPWPMGGAASRVEAYRSRVPSVHLAVRFDPAAWGRRQHAIAEVEALAVPEATVTTPDDYLALCERCLYDPTTAESIVRAQLEVAERVTDGARYWRQLLDAYEWWRSGLRATQ
jgi:hypothetical protein